MATANPEREGYEGQYFLLRNSRQKDSRVKIAPPCPQSVGRRTQGNAVGCGGGLGGAGSKKAMTREGVGRFEEGMLKQDQGLCHFPAAILS